MQGRFTSGAADGYTAIRPHHPVGLETFTATVVPILRERGLFREGYTGRAAVGSDRR